MPDCPLVPAQRFCPSLALPVVALAAATQAGAAPRSQRSVLEHLLGSGEGGICRNSHVRYHSHPFPGAAICSPHRAGGGDGDVQVSVVHVVGLWWLAAPTGHLPDDQGSAQPLHDVGEFLCGAGSQTAGQNDHTLLGAIAFTCKIQDPSK